MILIVLLTILKIIGIILAVILGIVVLLLLLVLFVPVRYKAGFARTGLTDDPPVVAKGYVSWLLHLVHVSFGYPDAPYYLIRIMGIPIKINKDSKPKKNKAKTKNKTKNKSDNKRPDSENTSKQEAETFVLKEDEIPEIPVSAADATTEEDFLASDDTLDGEQECIDESESTTDPETETPSLIDRIGTAINKLWCTIKSIYDKIVSILVGIRKKTIDVKKNIHYYHTILTSELFERTFEKCKKRVYRLLKEILPRKIDINFEVGFDDPYTTGEVLGIAGMLYPLLGEHFHVAGNFEESIIRGAGKLKGRIFGFSFLKIGLFYLFDKDLKRLIRLLKKEEKSRGRK